MTNAVGTQLFPEFCRYTGGATRHEQTASRSLVLLLADTTAMIELRLSPKPLVTEEHGNLQAAFGAVMRSVVVLRIQRETPRVLEVSWDKKQTHIQLLMAIQRPETMSSRIGQLDLVRWQLLPRQILGDLVQMYGMRQIQRRQLFSPPTAEALLPPTLAAVFPTSLRKP